ncbi:UDP-4-amino-4,6-dideoxy-N-acetyl-beta-L-altrosamine N-acetyltransferase [Treponema sp. R80B11-R83G3]
MSKTYRLIPLIDLDKETQLKVLEIRNEEYIRAWMFTGNKINADDHLAWIERLKNDKSQICLIIIDEDDKAFGAVNIKNIDKENKIAELGFYKSQNINEKGLMTKSLSTTIDYSFNNLGMEKIYSEVFDGNIKSLAIHKRLLFTEEGFLRLHKIKGGKRIGVHLFGLLKDEWETGKKKINIRDDIIVKINNV